MPPPNPSTPGVPADAPAWLWIGLPAALVVWIAVAPLLFNDEQWVRVMMGESGFLENATIIALVPAVVLGLMLVLRRGALPRQVGLWMLLGTIATFYFAGEEVSWGQHWFGWGTPETIGEINRQHETNIHNIEIEGWTWLIDVFFNNMPRQLMLVAAIAAIITSIVFRRLHADPAGPAQRLYWIIPTTCIIPVAALLIFSTVPEHLFQDTALDTPGSYTYYTLIEPGGELKELAGAAMILIYFVSAIVRFRAVRGAGAVESAGDG